jgi:hypothetical protein
MVKKRHKKAEEPLSFIQTKNGLSDVQASASEYAYLEPELRPILKEIFFPQKDLQKCRAWPVPV